MNQSVSVDEQEVTINLYPSSVDEYADVYSCIPAWTNKLAKFAREFPDERFLTELDTGVVARVPRGWVKVTPKRKSNLTEEQKQKQAEVLRRGREAKKAKEAEADGTA